MCNKAVEKYPLLLAEVPDHFKTQEMCNKAFEKDSCLLVFVPNCLRAQEICNKGERNWPWPSFFPDHLRVQETSNEIMHAMPDVFHWIFECFKKQGMC